MYNFLMGKKYLPYRIALGFILGIIVGLFFYDFLFGLNLREHYL